MAQYTIGGYDGLWEIVSGYEADNDIIVVFQNLGSGIFLEVNICPFEYMINDKLKFNKWDS